MLKTALPLKINLAALVIACLIFPNLSNAGFIDVPVKNVNYDAISALEQQGIIKGYPDGSFKPNQEIKRAELLKLVFNDVGYLAPEIMYETKFSDVPPLSWFAPYIKKALEIGIISINPDNPLFYPEAPITKIEALKMIMPVEGIPTPYVTEGSLIFDDIKPSSPYSYLVRAAQNAGLYTQKDGRLLYPFKNLTRGGAAELLYRSQIYRQSLPENSFITSPIKTDTNGYLTDTETQFLDNPKFPILLSVWSKINQQYINHDTLSKNDLVYGAIDGMVNSLNDPYSIFESPAQATAIENELEGTFEGIGTILDTFEKNLIVVSVLKDSPAEKAGIKAGDIIQKIDDTDVTGMEINQVIDLIKGPAGSTVTLTVKRDSQILSFKITRESLKIDTVIPETTNKVTIPTDISYISIYQFTSTTSAEFSDLFKTSLAKKPKGMILDLRDNPGGYLDAAFSILGHFFASGKTIMNLKIDGKILAQQSEGKGEFTTAHIPLIVLVNDGSASASEVVAGAIQDYKLGKLVGETTYGKGTVQEVTTYTDGSFFKLSIAHWLTPLKRDINKVGLIPDIFIERSKDDILNKTDSQLERAISELQK